MKKLVSVLVMVSAVLVLASCGASRKATSITEGEKEVNLVFNGPDYKTDKKYFRDNAIGISKDIANAKKIAVQNARQSIASMVQSSVKVLIDNYASTLNAEASQVSDGNDLQELGRTVVETQLSGLEIVEEKAFKLPDGTYRYHVCMQLSKDNLSKAMSGAIDRDAKTRLRSDKEAFRKYFDEKIR